MPILKCEKKKNTWKNADVQFANRHDLDLLETSIKTFNYFVHYN